MKSDHASYPDREKQLTTLSNELRSLLTIAAPLAAAYLAEIAMMLTDMAIVGRLGSLQLAAVGLTGDLMFAIMLFCMAVISMIGVLVAEAIGAGDKHLAARQVRLGFILSVGLAIPGMMLIWFLVPLLALTGQDPQVLAYGELYLHAAVWCFLPSILFVVLREFVAALSRPKSVMVITLVAVGLNALLSYGLVFGAFGLPALGVSGAGWATSIVCWFMFATLLWYVLRSKYFRQFPILKQDSEGTLAGCWRILVLGAPLGGIELMTEGLFAVTAILMGSISAVALAANQIVISIISISFVVVMAIGEAAAIRVALSVGEGRPAQARRAGVVGLASGVVFMTFAACIFLAAPKLLAAIFLNINDPANQGVVELAAGLFVIAGLFQVFDGMGIISVRALRGMRDTFVPMWISALGFWGLGVPCGYLIGFVLGYGAVGLWWGLAIGLSVTAIVLTQRFMRLSTLNTKF
ncbi:MAG: MATE family efflux transporter [Chloroflexi bacterium]|nr:MATE family efflux transporter [Chloroflexota bacterium]